jgi:hypothetical protein
VLDSNFIRIVKDTYNLPMIILKDWDDIAITELIYKDFDNSILDLQFIKKELRSKYVDIKIQPSS